MHLLDLPLEVIIQILSNLLLVDLFSCLRTNRTLLEVIRNSVVLQYRIELQLACVEDNPKSNLHLSERLAMLRHRERAWADFEYNFKTSILMRAHSSRIYDLTSGVYLTGDPVNHNPSINAGVNYVRLPSSPLSEQPLWSQININRRIVDFGTAIHEHNLIALVT